MPPIQASSNLVLNDPAALSLKMRQGSVCCRDVISAALSEAGALAPHCLTHLAGEQALSEAQTLDAANTVRQHGKFLAGIPVMVSEHIAVEGQPTTAGTALDVGDLLPAQGPLVKKFRDLGAVIVGKATVTEFALSYHNVGRDLPANPRYTGATHVAGGANSGAAVAVASGACGFAIGTDTGGTMRVPAAWCGITGFKPGTDFWSRDGMFPLSRDLDTYGILTRSVADLVPILEVLIGPISRLQAGTLRLGIVKDPFFLNLDPVIAGAVNAAFAKFAEKKVQFIPIVIPDISALDSFAHIVNSTALVRHLGRERVEREFDRADPVTQRRFRAGLDAGIGEIQSLYEIRRNLANRITSNLSHIDALITPTTTNLPAIAAALTDPETVMEWQKVTAHNVRFASLFNLAAITFQIPASQPVGLQVMATAGNEAKLAGVAHALQQTLDIGS